ncbi:MAG: methylmalonyl Co-A mutase-associated GTPase MeaB, partial [Myxococcales bacterium]|nr:methylmalonyl Co-A mutase-associated GTPase MeaB [Myxococcales bacterium]
MRTSPSLDAVLQGDQRAAGRLMSLAEDDFDLARPMLSQLFAHGGQAHVIGVTGQPGAGKSTLVNQLITHFRAAEERVGVVAVDPSSPFTGGAILGDRIRMLSHAEDPGVFVRSMAARGALGGLARATEDVICVLDAMGFDRIIVETVGVGQSEVEVAGVAHTTVVVMTPGYGDDIQAMKSGVLEIADVFVINKADLDGAAGVAAQLEQMLNSPANVT